MEDINRKIKRLGLKQGAIKILINSIYGAFGNKWFYFYNPDIAQSITLQGQDLIKFSIKAVNFYFKERWHLDTELHEILGISQYNISKVKDDAAIYTDTDSIYVQFDSALRSINGLSLTDEEYLKMCIKIHVCVYLVVEEWQEQNKKRAGKVQACVIKIWTMQS